MLGEGGLPKLRPASIPTLQQPLKMPHFHSLECPEDPVFCSKIGAPNAAPSLGAHSILHLSSSGAFLASQRWKESVGKGDKMTLVSLPPWCPCSNLSPLQLKRCRCMKPASPHPLPSLSGQGEAISWGHSCHLCVSKEPSVPEPQATAPPSILIGRKSTPRESAGPVQCATQGCDHDHQAP